MKRKRLENTRNLEVTILEEHPIPPCPGIRLLFYERQIQQYIFRRVVLTIIVLEGVPHVVHHSHEGRLESVVFPLLVDPVKNTMAVDRQSLFLDLQAKGKGRDR